MDLDGRRRAARADVRGHPGRPGPLRRRVAGLQPDPLERPGRHQAGPARRDRARHVHDGAGRAGAGGLGRRPGRGARAERPVHPAGGRAGRRRRRRGHGQRRRQGGRPTTATSRSTSPRSAAARRCSARRKAAASALTTRPTALEAWLGDLEAVTRTLVARGLIDPSSARPGSGRFSRDIGVWRNWQRSGLQNRRLQVRVLSPLRRWVRHASCTTGRRRSDRRAFARRRWRAGRNIHCESTEEGELAERKRRGDDAVDDRLDEAFDDDTAVDDELADDELDDDLDVDEDDDDDDDDEDDERRGRRAGRRARTGAAAARV